MFIQLHWFNIIVASSHLAFIVHCAVIILYNQAKAIRELIELKT